MPRVGRCLTYFHAHKEVKVNVVLAIFQCSILTFQFLSLELRFLFHVISADILLKPTVVKEVGGCRIFQIVVVLYDWLNKI